MKYTEGFDGPGEAQALWDHAYKTCPIEMNNGEECIRLFLRPKRHVFGIDQQEVMCQNT